LLQTLMDQDDVASIFRVKRESYATTITIVPELSSKTELVVENELYQDQMVRMVKVREAMGRTKMSKRSDVHELACVLDETLRCVIRVKLDS
jgi:hypothetical protein